MSDLSDMFDRSLEVKILIKSDTFS